MAFLENGFFFRIDNYPVVSRCHMRYGFDKSGDVKQNQPKQQSLVDIIPHRNSSNFSVLHSIIFKIDRFPSPINILGFFFYFSVGA